MEDALNQPEPTTSPHDKPWLFRKGNRCGRGNPLAGQVERLRARLLKNITLGDFDAITSKLIDMAKGGDLAAIREVFDRLFGKPRQEITKHIDGSIRTVAEGEDRAAALIDRIRSRFTSMN